MFGMFEEHPKKHPYKVYRPTELPRGRCGGVGVKRAAEKLQDKPGNTVDTGKVHNRTYVLRQQVMKLEGI